MIVDMLVIIVILCDEDDVVVYVDVFVNVDVCRLFVVSYLECGIVFDF